jgi:hypothetical protein
MPKYLIIIPLLIVQTAYAQQRNDSSNSESGIVVYHQKIDMRIPVLKDDTLKFDRSKSIFHWNIWPTRQGLERMVAKKHPGGKKIDIKKQPQRINLLDLAQDSLFSLMHMHLLGHTYYLKEEIPKIDWQFKDSSKKIGGYTCQKAAAYFRGRYYTAWFTPQIPLPYGPWKLNGLPGLILQASDSTGKIYFKARKVSFKDVGAIGPIQLTGEDQVITLARYKDMMNHFKKYMTRYVMKKVRGAFKKGVISRDQVNTSKMIKAMSNRFHPIETFNDSSAER